MKRKLFLVSMALVLVLSIFATACSGNKNDAGGNVDPNKPVDGGSVTFTLFSAPKGIFNPIMYEDAYDAYVIEWAFEPLWDYNEELQITTDLGLAEKVEFSEDKKTLTITMKKNAKWHDGEPVTIDDIIFTWETIAHPDYKGVRFSQVAMIKGAQEKHDKKADKISGITKVDDYTVKVELTSPIANILDQLWSWPIPEHVYKDVNVAEMGADAASKSGKVGNGQFKVKEVKANEYVILERNPDYYKGKPHLDQIVLKVVGQDVAVAALKKGEVDFLEQVAPKEFDQLSKDPNVVVKEVPDFGYQYLGFNHNSPKLQDKKLRQAIAYAINRKAMVDGLLKGHGYVLNQHIPSASWAYNEKLENAYPYDVEKAKALLAEAGYKDVNNDGFVEDPQGKPFSLKLDYPTGNPVREQSAPIIAQDLKKAGIKVDVAQPREVAAHYEAVEQDKVEMYLAGWSLTPDPDPTGIWLSTDAFNYLNYKNPKSDQLIKDAVTKPEAFTEEGRKKLLEEWTNLINDEVPQVFLYGQNEIYAISKRVQGVKVDARGLVTSEAYKWWVPKQK